tara:strand:- start:1533 stop:2900 length:1368 start_codon:yes stop_codon:yes gene_type:complete
MFKRVEIWILYLIILISIFITISFGVLVRQGLEGTTKAGNFSIEFLTKPAVYIARIPENFFSAFIQNIMVVNDRWKPNRDFYSQMGFKFYNLNQSKSENYYLLLSKYDGNTNNGIVELIDLKEFKTLHKWDPNIKEMNEELKDLNIFNEIRPENNSIMYHPLLKENGSLIFGWEAPLRHIDSSSKTLNQLKDFKFHHSIEEDEESNIWAPIYYSPPMVDNLKVGSSEYKDDGIVKINNDGDIVYEKSVSEMFIENEMEHLLFSVGDKRFTKDPIHLNDIQPVNSNSKFWKKGDIFLSLRHQSMVLLYRPSTNKIIWKSTGKFFHQHDVDILDDYRISIFNNNSKDFYNGNRVDGFNEVLIYDFEKDNFSSYMQNVFKEYDIKTVTEGRSEILPNGDLYIEESNHGRTLYFNSDSTLRWTHVNGYENGNVYFIGWSRLLYKDHEIERVKNFLKKNN